MVAAAEEMKMEVVDGLAAVFSGVDDHAVAFAEALVAGNQGRSVEKVTEEVAVLSVGIVERGKVLAGNDEDVDGRLRVNVREGVAELVLIDGSGGDGSLGDFAEEAGHEMTSKARPVYNLPVRAYLENLVTESPLASHPFRGKTAEWMGHGDSIVMCGAVLPSVGP